ncbi:hypothetical protein PINS_up006550 [Pythium insidiosum]|nr:hypothetical protein PINS_up006550 [Pythium insidiosum]
MSCYVGLYRRDGPAAAMDVVLDPADLQGAAAAGDGASYPAHMLRLQSDSEEEEEEEEDDGHTAAATAYAQDDDEYDGVSEFVCYGDRISLLCDGQLLAMSRKFNLTYQQMALLALSTLATGGLMGIASYFVWKRGLFRKRYAALRSDIVYTEHSSACDDDESDTARTDERHPLSTVEDLVFASRTGDFTAEHSIVSAPPLSKKSKAKKESESARAVVFRIFEYDPATQCIAYRSLGQPVRFGAPVVVAHAASRRAIRFKSHRGAVTISRPPRNPHFHRQVRENLEQIEASMAQAQTAAAASTAQLPRRSSLPRRLSLKSPRHRRPVSLSSAMSASKRLSRTDSARLRAMSLKGVAGQAVLPPSDPVSASEEPERGQLAPRSAPPAADVSANVSRPKGLVRSISESCITFVQQHAPLSKVEREERKALKRRAKLLRKNLPNMWFPGQHGQYFVGKFEAVYPQMARTASGSSEGESEHPVEQDDCLRYGAPHRLVAAFNGHACGFRTREYYRDHQCYMTTEKSATTMIAIPERGDLAATIAKESLRRLAHIENPRVQLRVGTFNVWMMPRKLSMFTSISPRKNTRAKLIADVLPPCDIWVFTECFDHRARRFLLDGLKTAGYYFDSPTVGHKQRGPDGRYLDKLLNGGVVLASRYPILSVRVQLFKELSAGSDKFADKGVLYCQIVKNGLLVHVFATHLQAWNDPPSRKARRGQLEMVAAFMRRMNIDATRDAVIFTGDFNVDFWLHEKNGEYDEMLDILCANDPSIIRKRFHGRQIDSSEPSVPAPLSDIDDAKRLTRHSFDGRLNPLASDGLSSDGSLELLDYVLVSRAHRQPLQAKSWVQPMTSATPWYLKGQPQYHLSDHFPVISELVFDV